VTRWLEISPDAMVVTGADGRIVRINSQVEKLFGYTCNQWLEQEPDPLFADVTEVQCETAGG
jgi:PAS domain S-box-containing protein